MSTPQACLQPAPRQTTRWAELIYGEVPLDDPAEAYHEASKVSACAIGRQVEGAWRLKASPDLQLSASRSVKRLPHRVTAALPPPELPRLPLQEALERRRSERTFADERLAAVEVATLLHAAYGVTGLLELPEGGVLPLRAVPSGGALYPLEIYVVLLRAEGLDPGLYHYDPLRPALEAVRGPLSPDETCGLSAYPEIVSACGALFLIAAVFWRTRFKYGLRSYRFALLEAGHVGQNLVLTASGLGLVSVPLGGFYDRPTDELLGLDGVNESALYAVAVGRRAEEG